MCSCRSVWYTHLNGGFMRASGIGFIVLGGLGVFGWLWLAPGTENGPTAACPSEIVREDTLRALQERVMRVVPRELGSLESAVAQGGLLEGFELSHGHVVLSGMGVSLVKIGARDPMPQLLFYRPSASSSPEEWLDFDGANPPYRFVGWGYLPRFENETDVPAMHCIPEDEWFIHEAGWHLLDGDMRLTPNAASEPARPEDDKNIWYWHPRSWDIHLWYEKGGVPRISKLDEKAPEGGLSLPDGAFVRP
jgi:hypothetical protein